MTQLPVVSIAIACIGVISASNVMLSQYTLFLSVLGSALYSTFIVACTCMLTANLLDSSVLFKPFIFKVIVDTVVKSCVLLTDVDTSIVDVVVVSVSVYLK